MNKKNKEKIKKKLDSQKKELRNMLERFAKEDDKPEGDWDTIFPEFNVKDLEEEADEVEEYESLRSIEHLLEKKLKKTSEALEKIGQKNFGKCESCNKEIEMERLEKIPEAKTCKKCKD